MRIDEWVLVTGIGIVMCLFAYSSGFFIKQFISVPHGGTLFILIVAVANSLIFGYTICTIINAVRRRRVNV